MPRLAVVLVSRRSGSDAPAAAARAAVCTVAGVDPLLQPLALGDPDFCMSVWGCVMVVG